jgi:hypothetical protein
MALHGPASHFTVEGTGMTAQMNELGFYTLAGAPKAPA